jgi:hypothetical protein
MGGCIIGWVSSVVQLPSVCASTLSGTRLSVPSRLYRRTNNYGAKVWKAVWGTIFIWGESTGVDGYTEQNFSPRDNTSWCFKTIRLFSCHCEFLPTFPLLCQLEAWVSALSASLKAPTGPLVSTSKEHPNTPFIESVWQRVSRGLWQVRTIAYWCHTCSVSLLMSCHCCFRQL